MIVALRPRGGDSTATFCWTVGGRRRLHDDLLLLGRLQVAFGLRLGAQALHGVHHVLLLREERVAELLGPVELLVHHREHLRERDQRLDARVPGLALAARPRGPCPSAFGFAFEPARRFDDLERIGRGHQHLREQRVGIERDRRDELLDLLRLERRFLSAASSAARADMPCMASDVTSSAAMSVDGRCI